MTTPSPQRGATLAALFVAAVAAVGATAAADSHDEQFLDGLRRRGLFELAEKYCTDRLADSKLDRERHATLVVELSRTYAGHAVQAPPDERAPLWEKAQRVVDDFGVERPGDPRLLLVRTQGALAALARGELVRQEAELAADAPRDRERARAILRAAIGDLRKLKKTVDVDLRNRNRAARRTDDGQLSAAELSSLGLHIQYQLARALRNQGLCYPAASADRINSLGQAIELLEGLARHEMRPSLAWRVRIDEIICQRLVGDYNEAERKLSQAERSDPPVSVLPRLREERIRLPLARGRIDEALSEAGPPGAKRDAGSAGANLAKLEAYLAGRRRALDEHDADAAQRWENGALTQVRAIERDYGPTSARRAETLLARSIAQSAGPENPRTMLLAAQSLYRGGRIDEARAAYDRVAKRAAATGDKNSYFDSQYAVGALEYERQNHREALARLAKLAITMPQHPRAAEAHLLAIHSAAQVAQQQDPPQLDEYKKLLRQHVDLWPDGATASQAWWWLGRLAQHDQAWQDAIRALKHVRADHPRYAPAVEAVGQCYESALGQLRKRGNRNELLARDAVAYLQQVIVPPGAASPARTEAARAAILAAARIYLKEIRGGGAKAEQLLNAALRDDANGPARWKRQARALLVPALAAGGHVASAEELLGQLPIGAVADALAMVELLEAIKQQAPLGDKSGLARLELAVIGDVLAKQSELDDATIKGLVRRRADTLLESGDRDAALSALRALAEKYPRDGEVQEDMARRLTADGDDPSRREALAKWREIAQHCRTGSARWLRAHLAIARLQLDSGNASRARATIKLVAAGQPDMGGPKMKARFQQLLAECERSPGGRRSPN